MRPPFLLTGGPAVGKSSTARLLARLRARAAFVDVEDVRQMVVGGHAAPWEGEEGRRQQRLGVENACSLARNFVAQGDEEFEALHLNDARHRPAADHHIDVTDHDIDEQVAAIAALWQHAPCL